MGFRFSPFSNYKTITEGTVINKASAIDTYLLLTLQPTLLMGFKVETV